MDILDRLLGHNGWTTRQLLERCRPLSNEQFTRRFECGPGSLHDTLLHIVETMGYWADRIADRPYAPSRDDEGLVRSVDEIIAMLDVAERELESTARDVAATDRLDESMHVTWQERVYEFTRGTAIVHVATHGMHHRAQAIWMFRQLGVPCDLDGDTIEWEMALRVAG